MAYEQVSEILESIRQFHHQLRREMEEAYSETEDPRSKFLLRSIRRGEQDMDLALGRYKNDGEAPVLDTWIQYVPSEELEMAQRSRALPPQSPPEEVREWKREFDAALAAFYSQLADQVSAPRAKELFESLATMTEQRVSDQSWQGQDDDLAPGQDD